MKKLRWILLLPAFGLMFACEGRDCQEPTGACADTPPTGEACAAYFVRWFYNTKTGTCHEVGYSGCNQKGFATESECLSCQGR